MSNKPQDINDDEIRIISSDRSARRGGDDPKVSAGSGRRRIVIALFIAVVIIAAAVVGMTVLGRGDAEENPDNLELVTAEANNIADADKVAMQDSTINETADKGFVAISDTVVNHALLSIFRPVNAVPSLHVGTDVLGDSTAVLVVQAADVRSDNGGIVGAYVKGGELLSKGQAKSGFCAIIGGKLTIGVADSTPFLEQALETDGDFFRQYPLVVAKQIVENKPKGRALRKALAELNGEPVIVMSREKMSFHDFSQSLVDLGATNAIYLVGSSAYGFAIAADGKRTEFGSQQPGAPENTNYLVWR